MMFKLYETHAEQSAHLSSFIDIVLNFLEKYGLTFKIQAMNLWRKA